MYDLIGDLHGHASALEELLEKMGYQLTSSGWQHPKRKVIFLGDYIDRGPNQLNTINLVRNMLENDQALAIMGNHEFNAVAYATPHPKQAGAYLRPHEPKNLAQHQAYLEEVAFATPLHQEHLDWFKSLPLYLDLPELRAIHACWHPQELAKLKPFLDEQQRIKEDAWLELALHGTPAFRATETLLKGLEVALPSGYSFKDKDGTERKMIRTKWWDSSKETYYDLAMLPEEDKKQLPKTPVSTRLLPNYLGDKPLFLGHYWRTGTPQPLSQHIACLDYSIAGGKDRKLCAYRFQGEKIIRSENFVWVTG